MPLALVHLVVGLFKVIAHEFERRGLVEVADGKDA
jgi:hypothetical protein